MELPVSLNELHTDRRVIESRQTPSGDRIQELLAEQLLTQSSQIGRAVVNEGLQRGFAGAELGVFVKRNFFHRLERAAVAEEHAQVADFGAETSVG